MSIASNLCVVENLTYLRTSLRSAIEIRLCENDTIFTYSVTKVTNNQYYKIIGNLSFFCYFVEQAKITLYSILQN